MAACPPAPTKRNHNDLPKSRPWLLVKVSYETHGQSQQCGNPRPSVPCHPPCPALTRARGGDYCLARPACPDKLLVAISPVRVAPRGNTPKVRFRLPGHGISPSPECCVGAIQRMLAAYNAVSSSNHVRDLRSLYAGCLNFDDQACLALCGSCCLLYSNPLAIKNFSTFTKLWRVQVVRASPLAENIAGLCHILQGAADNMPFLPPAKSP